MGNYVLNPGVLRFVESDRISFNVIKQNDVLLAILKELKTFLLVRVDCFAQLKLNYNSVRQLLRTLAGNEYKIITAHLVLPGPAYKRNEEAIVFCLA